MITQTGQVFDKVDLGIVRSMVDFDHSAIEFQNGNLVFKASDALVKLDPSLGTNPPTVALPVTTVSPGGLSSDYLVAFSAFAIDGGLAAVTIDFEANDIDIRVPFTASMVGVPQGLAGVAFGIDIQSGSSIDVKLSWIPSWNSANVDSVTADVHWAVTGNPAFTPIIQSQMPDMNATFQSAIQGMLGNTLSQPSTGAAVLKALYSWLGQSITPQPATPWSAVPGSLVYGTSGVLTGLYYSIQRVDDTKLGYPTDVNANPPDPKAQRPVILTLPAQ
jgi:hypothetical protein